MSDYDRTVEDRIAELHADAEFLYDLARNTEDDRIADAQRRRAVRLVKQAARLRAAEGE